MIKSGSQNVEQKMIEKQIYEREMDKRKKLDIFDYLELARDMRLYTEGHFSNAWYGHDRAIRNYLNLPMDAHIDGTIEHGPTFDDFICEVDVSDAYSTIFVQGARKRDALRKNPQYKEKTIVSVEPYIVYARSFYSSERIEAIKKAQGKTLLVFVGHSIPKIDVEFDIDEFIREIERIKEKHCFQSVMICLYWNDIMLGKDKKFKERGYILVTAGHPHDYLFLDRLKSIILIADVTMSNEMGSHVVYCLALGKAHYYFSQLTDYTVLDRKGIDFNDNFKKIDGIQEVGRQLSVFRETMNSGDIQIFKKYWGV